MDIKKLEDLTSVFENNESEAAVGFLQIKHLLKSVKSCS